VVAVLGLTAWLLAPAHLPRRVVIAAGRPAGMYYLFSSKLRVRLQRALQRPVEVLQTEGSGQNRELLETRRASLAIMQASGVSLDRISAIAPLYFEPIHVLVRRELSDVDSVPDLAGLRVSLGPAKSGMRYSALKILSFYKVDATSLRESARPFTDLASADLDAAIVTTGLGNPELVSLLQSNAYRLLALDAPDLPLKRPSFKSFVIRPEDYPQVDSIPRAGLHTVASTALLATYSGAADKLVLKSLQSLYDGSQLAKTPGSIRWDDAAGWDSLPWHPAARRYFSQRMAAR
jgi:TRAP transporter TAXI family solute receptor